MALSDSTQNQPQEAERLYPTLSQTCVKQEVQIQNYALFAHRVSALLVLSGAFAVRAADGMERDVLVREIAQLHKHLADIVASGERIQYEVE